MKGYEKNICADTQDKEVTMKKLGLILIVFGVIGVGTVYGKKFTLKCDDLGGELTEMPVCSGFGCTGKNISPSVKTIAAFVTTLHSSSA